MSTVAEVATDSTGNYYDPSQEKSYTRLAKGVYPAHIIKCETVVRPIKNKYKACIYNYRIKVHASADQHTYQIEDIDGTMKDVSGAEYVGREIRSQGIFLFLTPGRVKMVLKEPL